MLYRLNTRQKNGCIKILCVLEQLYSRTLISELGFTGSEVNTEILELFSQCTCFLVLFTLMLQLSQ